MKLNYNARMTLFVAVALLLGCGFFVVRCLEGKFGLWTGAEFVISTWWAATWPYWSRRR